MRLHHETLRIPYRTGRFAIAGESGSHATTIIVTLHDDAHPGLVGIGEAVPSKRVMDMDHSAVTARLDAAAQHLKDVALDPDGPPPALPPQAGAQGAAACALDGALLDLWARARGEPLWRALGLKQVRKPTTATISLAAPEAMAAETRNTLQAGFTHLKVKLGEEPRKDEIRLDAIRAVAPRASLLIDGNEAWSTNDALAMVPILAAADVALVEQPLARGASPADHHTLNAALDEHGITHILDESVHTAKDAERIARERLAHGVNLKLQKAGGLRAGLALLDVADERGLKVLIGCFIETWAGIALAAQLAGRAEWLDLDGAWLLGEDPVQPQAPILQEGHIGATDRPGLGVETEAGHRKGIP